MSIPFDPKELEIAKRAPSFRAGQPGKPLFTFPVSEREAMLSLFRGGEAVWMPYGVETSLFCPHIIPDNIARGFVFEATPPGTTCSESTGRTSPRSAAPWRRRATPTCSRTSTTGRKT